MKKIGIVLLISTTLALGGMVTSCQNGIGGKRAIKSDADTAAYAMGIMLAAQSNAAEYPGKAMPGDSLDREIFLQGFADAVRRVEGIMTPDSAMAILNTYAERALTKSKEKNEKEGNEFLAKNKGEKDVQETASGLQYKVDSLGTGITATAQDTVLVHYKGTLLNGEVFDSSYDRGEPALFPLSGVIPGFTEGLQLAPAGSKFTLWIPGNLAYGENVRPGGSIGPNQLLRFDIELLEVRPVAK